jgi:uncharacterized protein (TIGR03435 family)
LWKTIFTTWYEIYVETKQPVSDIRPVLQDILREKFRLDLRLDKVPTRMLVLRTPRGEPQLPVSKHPACTVDDGNAGTSTVETGTPDGSPSASAVVFFRGCRIADLASELSSRMFTPVINEASAAGRYDFAIPIGGLFAFRREATLVSRKSIGRMGSERATACPLLASLSQCGRLCPGCRGHHSLRPPNSTYTDKRIYAYTTSNLCLSQQKPPV